jgi:hypothetical protein
MTAPVILGTGCPGPNNDAVLFVLDDCSDSIARVVSFRNPANADGDQQPDTWLEGDETMISIWAGPMVTDSRGALYILTDYTSVAVFEDATSADGNCLPDRLAELENLSDITGGMALGPTEEWLLLIDGDDNRFKAYSDPTTEAFDGSVPLAAATEVHEELGIPIGAQYVGDKLFVKDRTDGHIYVYREPEMATIDLGPEWRLGSFFVDGDDNLYVTDTQDVAVYRHASALEGDVEPDLILTIPDAEMLGSIIVGSDGTGYITDPNRNAVYVYHDIADRGGEVAPDGTILGPHTGLSGPGLLALYEP